MRIGELLPGTVVQVVDKEKGIVKCTAPSMFSVNDDPEVLPPIIPFAPSGHLGSVSTPEEGDLVWIVVDNSNSQMIYYIRRYAIPDELSNIDSPREVFFVRNDENGFYIEEEDVEFISHIAETQYGIQISKRFEGKYFPSFNRVLYTIYKTDNNEPDKLRWKKDLTLVLFSQRDGSLVPKFFIP